MSPPAKKKKIDSSIFKEQKQHWHSRKSVRIAKKRRKRLREIKVCDDVWLSILPCFGPEEVGLKLAPLSRRFDGLVDLHFRMRKWVLDQLKIGCSKNGIGAEVVRKKDFITIQSPSRSGRRRRANLHLLEGNTISYVDLNKFSCFQRIRLPIALPQGAPPVSLVGFKIISIHYVDNNVIDFLLRIRQLCKSGITLKFSSDNKQSIDIVSRHIMPHFKSIISGLKLSNSCCVAELRSHCSPKILLECSKLQSICCSGIISQAGQAIALYEWLHTPRGDNHPKMLICWFVEESLEELKMNFLNATTPVSYIFLFYNVLYDVEPFELMNRETRERLTFFEFEARPNFRRRKCMERSPIARDEKQWKKWEQEALDLYGTSIKNVIEICSHDRDFQF